MTERSHPFLAPLIEEGSVTICVLSDSKMQLRDSWALCLLVEFLAKRGVRIEMCTMLAGFRRYADCRDLLRDLPPGSAARRKAETILNHPVLTLEEMIEQLYMVAEEGRRQRIEALQEGQRLPESGPSIVLGRPRLYPRWFFEALDAELRTGPSGTGIAGRFRLEVDDPLELMASSPAKDRGKYRNVVDTYSQISLPEVPFPDSGIEEGTFVDYGVIRLVRGPRRSRSALFLYGAGSLGTMGAAQAVVDPGEDETIARFDVGGLFQKYGAAEALVRVERQSRAMSPWPGRLSPGELEVIAPPMPPVSEKVGAWISAFRSAQEGAVLLDLHKCTDATTDAKRFDTIGIHPPIEHEKTDPEEEDEDEGEDEACGEGRRKKKLPHPRAHTLVGGAEVRDVVRRIQELVAGGERLILIQGEDGVIAGLAARIVYEENAIRLFERLPQAKGAPAPLFPGPRFVEFRSGDAAKGDEEGRLAGVAESMPYGAPARGALFSAGEGVVHVIDVEKLSPGAQAVILEVAHPPHWLVPIGARGPIPVTALIVASTSADLRELAGAGGMLPPLESHLSAHAVRIPSLRERPGDIPALLASVAGESIRLREHVLQCLLAARHERNLHGLIGIVDRAKARRRASSKDVLVIGETDLEPDMAELFKGLYEERSRRGYTASDLWFEFSSVRQDAAAAPLFVEAADILGSLACQDRRVFVRPHAPELRAYWPSQVPCGYDELFRRWLNLIDRALEMRARAGDGRPTGIDPLELLRRISHGRWSHNPVRRPIASEFVRAYLRWGEKKGMLQKDAAQSIQISRAVFATLAGKLRASVKPEE